MADKPHTQERSHPTPVTYVQIAVLLAVVTLLEVWIVYQEALASIMVFMLLVLSAIKFAMVALFFMHLRFDNRLFSILFTAGLLLASFVMIALMALFQVLVG